MIGVMVRLEVSYAIVRHRSLSMSDNGRDRTEGTCDSDGVATIGLWSDRGTGGQWCIDRGFGPGCSCHSLSETFAEVVGV